MFFVFINVGMNLMSALELIILKRICTSHTDTDTYCDIVLNDWANVCYQKCIL